jgi:DNA-binding IclR family transcriptional regulator
MENAGVTRASSNALRDAPPADPVQAEPEQGSISALTRLLQILDLFTLERPTVRVEEVVDTFKIVQSTAYRYLRELCDAGLLAPQGKGAYSLGRRIVELELILQLSDPLLLAGKPVLDELGADHPNRAFLLCAHHRDGALCIYKVGPEEIRYRGTAMKIYRGRGTLLPLFTGVGSQVILANLPPHQIKSLFLSSGRQIAEAGLGDTWKEFRGYLAELRKRGYAESLGKLNPGMHSLAVPILRADGRVAGSLLMLGSASKDEMDQALALVPRLLDDASTISARMPDTESNGRD